MGTKARRMVYLVLSPTLVSGFIACSSTAPNEARRAAEAAEVDAHHAIAEARREERVETLGERRTRMQIEAREREVRRAEDRAEAAEAEAETARDDAQLLELDVAAARADSAEDRAAAAEAELEELRRLGVEQSERGLVFTLTSGLFAVDRAELQPGATAELDRIVEFLSSHEERSVFVEGHTDSQGIDAYNLELSRRRGQAVADPLLARGVSARRILVAGPGETQPIAPNGTAAGRQQNRRVEVVITR